MSINFANSHRGGVERSGKFKGCHKNRKLGGFHCHSKSPFNGRSWSSREAAEKSVSGSRKLKQSVTKYSRSLFGSWLDTDKDCLNTRHEILKTRSLVPVKMSKDGCRVISGKWKDFYYDEILTQASQIDIDHVVPLKHAFDNGANKWKKKKRVKFANDLENLVITNLKYNRQKGSQTPLTWMPINRTYACEYFIKWNLIKNKYKINISKKELDYFKMLKCEGGNNKQAKKLLDL